MILEREQWHLGYASLLRDCRSVTSSNNNNTNTTALDNNNVTIGRALLLVHPDSTDALATARILSYMLRADGVPYQIRPCLGLERLKLILRSVGVLSPNNGDNNGEEFEGNIIEQHDTNNDGGGSVNDVRAVVLINMGANRNLSKLFTTATTSNNNDHNATTANNNNIRAYVFDNHRPYHLANIHTGKNVVLFNDRPLDIDEVVSDGDNLSGDESSTSSEESDDDDSDDSDDEGKGEESSDGEEEFELDQDGEDGNAAAESGGGGVRGGEEGDLVDSDDDDDDDSDNNGREMKRQKRDNDGVNPLDTTAATADLTMTTTQGEEEEEDGDLDQEDATQQQQQQPVISLRDLHRQRRNRIRLHYSSGSYHASPSSWTAYTLCTQLRFGDTPDLLWLACVGVTDAYLHGRLDVSGYSALTVDLKRHVGRLFPNELVDRAGRAVYAEDLERGFDASDDYTTSGGSGGGAMTQISLSENGRILSQPEYKFMLLRHTTLWESIMHSNFVASKLQVWKATGRQKLMELLAKMGFPLDQCRQPWAFVGTNMRRRLRERLEECTEVSYLLLILFFCYQRRLRPPCMWS